MRCRAGRVSREVALLYAMVEVDALVRLACPLYDEHTVLQGCIG